MLIIFCIRVMHVSRVFVWATHKCISVSEWPQCLIWQTPCAAAGSPTTVCQVLLPYLYLLKKNLYQCFQLQMLIAVIIIIIIIYLKDRATGRKWKRKKRKKTSHIIVWHIIWVTEAQALQPFSVAFLVHYQEAGLEGQRIFVYSFIALQCLVSPIGAQAVYILHSSLFSLGSTSVSLDVSGYSSTFIGFGHATSVFFAANIPMSTGQT